MRKIHKLNLLLIFTLFYFQTLLYSQLNPNTLLPNVMPSNPQAFQFMKYGEIPVLQYTGTPNISIPIYNLETKGLNIPIVLKYHPNGIKVNEEASWVGLGWSLSTDMEVVQTVQGLDDFGYFSNRTLANFNCMIPLQASGLSANSAMSGCTPFFLSLDDEWNQNQPNCFFDPRYMAGLWDTEPDVFYFNAVGYSGKFSLNWSTGKFVCLTDKNIKIESGSLNNNIDLPFSLIITVADGHRFQFTLKDSTTIDFCSNNSSSGVIPSNIDPRGEKSSRVYKLTSIITSKADVITFEYENSQNINNGTITDAVSKNFPYISNVIRNEVSNNVWNPISSSNNPSIGFAPNSLVASGYESLDSSNREYVDVTSYTGTSQTYSYLKKINYNGQQIKFLTSSRIDLKESKKLDQIIVSLNGSTKRFVFNYDYFTGNNLGNNWDSFLTFGGNSYICGKNNDEITKRLKLVSFNELDQKPYVFEYNNQSLPKKTSYSLDYWGFYNGMNNNISFMPNLYSFNIQRHNTNYYYNQYNTNSPILNFCKASTLEKITYPTGGTTLFEYELNSFSNYKVPQASQGSTAQFNISTNSNNPPHTMETVLIEGGSTIFNIYGLLSIHGCSPQISEAYTNCYLRVTHFKKELLNWIKNDRIMNIQLQTYGINYVLGVVLDFLDDSPSNPTLYNQYLSSDTYLRKTFRDGGYVYADEYVNNQKISLAEGIAVFRVKGGCGVYSPTSGNNWSQSSFNINYRIYKPLPEGDSNGAGLRIKTISSYTNNYSNYPSRLAFKKSYQYEGGKLMSPLLYFNRMPSSYQDHRVVGIQPLPSDYECASIPTQLTMLNFEIDKNFALLNKNPNKKIVEYINTFFEESKSISLTNRYGNCVNNSTTPIWVLMKSFLGYLDELHSQNYITPSTSASGRYVGYDKVTEKYEDNNNSFSDQRFGIGKEVSYYNNNPDIGVPPLDTGGGYFTQINLPLLVKFPENGNLTQKEIFNKDNILKKKILNFYQYRKEPCLWGMKTLTTNVTDKSVYPGYYKKYAKYLVGVYPLQSGKTIFTRREITNFEEGNEITEVINYDYDSHNQVSKITEERATGNIETQLNYPYDLSSTSYNIYNGMVARNIISPVIVKSQVINSNILSQEKYTYKSIATPNSNSYFQSSYAIDEITILKDGQFIDPIQHVIFHNYDKYANPTEVSKKGGTRTSYIWGYNGKYPIAKIENASQPNNDNASQGLTLINSNLSNAAIEASNSGSEENLITALNNLRASLPNALVTTYTYKPLIGVSTITDPKGDKITYSYDSFGRLQSVTDKDGNVLSENQYNYRTN